MSLSPTLRPLLLILSLSTLLAIGFAWATPIGGAPDEGAHLEYVRTLATKGRLPKLDLERRRREHGADPGYESHQPPLYYALCVPFFHVGRALGGEKGAGQACRVLSILIGLLGTVLVWRLSVTVAPDRPALALAASAFVALLPMRLALMASVSNDILNEVTCTLALILMLRLQTGGATVRQAAILGGAVGLALVVKQNAILLLPPALISLAAGAAPRGAAQNAGSGGDKRRKAADNPPEKSSPDSRRILALCGAFGTVLLAVSGWWYAHNQILYGDPLAQRMFNTYFEDTPRWVNFRDAGDTYLYYLGRRVLPTAFDSFWGAFGHLDPTKPQLFMGAYGEGPPGPRWHYPPDSWLYPILLATVIVAIGGGVRYYFRKRAAEDDPQSKLAASTLGMHAVFVFAAFLNFNTTYFQAQGRYMAQAIGALGIALAGGWLEWVRHGRADAKRVESARERFAAWSIVALMVALAAYALFGVVLPGFASG